MIGMSRMTMVTRMTNKKRVLIGMTSMAMQNYELDDVQMSGGVLVV